jgi:hypothetical protein
LEFNQGLGKGAIDAFELFLFFTSRRRSLVAATLHSTSTPSQPPHLPPSNQQPSAATAASACRALSVVFQAAGARGDLEGEEAEEEEAGAEGETDEAKAAEHCYRRWLRARFADHAKRLRSLLSLSGRFPATQAAAARACLEASRAAVTGKLDAGLFGSCLDALLLADACSISSSSSSSSPAVSASSSTSGGGGGASAEAVSVFLSKAGLADVRHSLLKALPRCAAALAASFSSISSSNSSSTSPSSREALRDAASTLVDVLIRIPALPERKATGNEEENEDSLFAESWCGGEEVGKACAASGASGSRERRKRKQQQGKINSIAGVSWALPREHRKAARLAWQSVLLLPSPRLLPREALSTALRALPGALPGMDRPALLCDALTDAVSGGGGNGGNEAEGKASPSFSSSSAAHATAVAALAALFELIVRHGLEYPVSCWLIGVGCFFF